VLLGPGPAAGCGCCVLSRSTNCAAWSAAVVYARCVDSAAHESCITARWVACMHACSVGAGCLCKPTHSLQVHRSVPRVSNVTGLQTSARRARGRTQGHSRHVHTRARACAHTHTHARAHTHTHMYAHTWQRLCCEVADTRAHLGIRRQSRAHAWRQLHAIQCPLEQAAVGHKPDQRQQQRAAARSAALQLLHQGSGRSPSLQVVKHHVHSCGHGQRRRGDCVMGGRSRCRPQPDQRAAWPCLAAACRRTVGLGFMAVAVPGRFPSAVGQAHVSPSHARLTNPHLPLAPRCWSALGPLATTAVPKLRFPRLGTLPGAPSPSHAAPATSCQPAHAKGDTRVCACLWEGLEKGAATRYACTDSICMARRCCRNEDLGKGRCFAGTSQVGTCKWGYS
jgi:hypothetical protein